MKQMKSKSADKREDMKNKSPKATAYRPRRYYTYSQSEFNALLDGITAGCIKSHNMKW